MLALLGFLTIVVLLGAILSRRVSPLTALVVVPVVGSLAGGFGVRTGGFMVHGIQSVANVAGMFVFAILFFGVMTDAGMLDPIIDRILRKVGSHPPRIVVGTALLALLVHLDGSGAVTFLITIPAMLPLYERLGMDKRVLACAASLAAGVNFLPWTGPMIRAAAALHIPVLTIFRPLLPVQIAGLAFVFGSAWWLGRREAVRLSLGAGSGDAKAAWVSRELSPEELALRRPRLFWFNVGLTLALVFAMVAVRLDPFVVFMVGFVIAIAVNYPNLAMQRERIDAHARAALTMAAILFAAGAFTGIMKESGMLSAMAASAIHAVPTRLAHHLPLGLALISMPLSLLRSGFVLLRCVAGAGGGCWRLRRAGGAYGAGFDPGADDDRVSDQPVDARNVLDRWNGRSGVTGPSEVQLPFSVWRDTLDDDSSRRARSSALLTRMGA